MLDVAVTLFAIMAGCCSNVITLEMLMKRDSGSGDLITFCQFVFVAVEGLFFHIESTNSPSPSNSTKIKEGKEKITIKKRSWFPFRIKPRKIPIPYYMVMVLIFFAVSVLNNKALGYKISLPFHMIFRSGSLFANMFLGILIFKKRYSWQQIGSVFLLTFGVFMATAASASQIQRKNDTQEESTDFVNWVIGVSMLCAALLLSSCLGLYQEWTYSLFGKDHYRESMFYSHILALPFFGFFYNELITHAKIYNQSPLISLPLPFLNNFEIPVMWWNMIINVLTQYICIRGVFTIGGLTGSSLTSTLAISVRKFISLVISVVYFGNPFSPLHWFSTFLVFAGTILYTFAPKPDAIKTPVRHKKKD